MPFYATYAGHTNDGVFTDWEACKREIHKKPKYKKFGARGDRGVSRKRTVCRTGDGVWLDRVEQGDVSTTAVFDDENLKRDSAMLGNTDNVEAKAIGEIRVAGH